MSEKKYKSDPLWSILVDVVKILPRFQEHLAYVRDEILPKRPDISAEELSRMLSLPLGEALVILDELREFPCEVEEELSKDLPDPEHERVALGGTFSKLHYGHMRLLLEGFRLGRTVIIGVTTDEFAGRLGKKYIVPPFEARVNGLKSFLQQMGWINRCEILPLHDPYGVTVVDPDLEALITSPFTHYRGIEINEIRSRRGLKPLKIVVCPLVVAWDGRPISSTRIFLGEINEKGEPL
ncbi:MAG: pantetheine-phosphate adenylyltransferase [Thaumarchaeota archaeon]|jgi:pantetheine-phosphate adenylyltransferase|nr:pantetheine-phosphate adenylyltransferase [Candidatus Wolframiiraptor allenii]